MRRYFNTEGWCAPERHYMVSLKDRLEKIKRLYVDKGKYFTINRGRQYGKTTTLRALAKYLKEDYVVFSMDFQLMSTACFADEQTFVIKFIQYIKELYFEQTEVRENIAPDTLNRLLSLKEGGDELQGEHCYSREQRLSMDMLFRALSGICRMVKKPIVMIIDEVDSASNSQVFLDFLAMLRGYYLSREEKPIFHSVIFAGVYDVKNLKRKYRPEEAHRYNSPWNIAAVFDMGMSFSACQIQMMLREYEADNYTGMDVKKVADEIYQYTSGYPYLVSAICKSMDERLQEGDKYKRIAEVWTKEGVSEAVKLLQKEKIPLFDSMVRQLDMYKDLRGLIEEMIYQGKKIPFSPDTEAINIGVMFGFLKEKDGQVIMANRIFEMRMLNMFIAEEALRSDAFRRSFGYVCQVGISDIDKNVSRC